MQVEFEFAQYEPRTMPDLERTAVVENQSGHASAVGLDHVSLEQNIAIVERHDDAVAQDRYLPFDPYRMSDHLHRRRRRILGCVPSGSGRSRQCRDDFAAQRRTIRRPQRVQIFRFEIAGNDVDLSIDPNQPQVISGTLEIGAEKQMRVLDGHGRLRTALNRKLLRDRQRKMAITANVQHHSFHQKNGPRNTVESHRRTSTRSTLSLRSPSTDGCDQSSSCMSSGPSPKHPAPLASAKPGSVDSSAAHWYGIRLLKAANERSYVPIFIDRDYRRKAENVIHRKSQHSRSAHEIQL
ncbi:hypothetical protein [Bradyrhizobium stylosanthis]|uniref:hypothetical protein n=1 Tax=Bradyrhizobium stylosanthis TaxID=1803665 RepID=UPI001FEE49D1|nr:hypothetical protein [Bradyrhizobium stylosanthis]